VESDAVRRQFYFEQTATQRWSVRELSRQIQGALFERVTLSRDTSKLVAIEKKKGPPEAIDYRDAFKDPYLLDFLGLTAAYSEKDFESAIIANLQQFLTELGAEFCFIRRQYPMRIDDDDYFVDLLFYHRGMRCLVAIDLKIGPFTAADKGQMDLYLSWLKRHEWRDGESEPVGLILCTSKKKQHVELLLAHGSHKMQVSEYLTKLPEKKGFDCTAGYWINEAVPDSVVGERQLLTKANGHCWPIPWRATLRRSRETVFISANSGREGPFGEKTEDRIQENSNPKLRTPNSKP
jgi:predicted nuclease of restriction endonuclease-like (RecB) superfamily